MEASDLFKRILVGVDDAGLAKNAILRAAALGEALDADIELVHVIEVPPPLWPRDATPVMHATAIAHSRARMLELLGEMDLPALGDDLDALLTVQAGHPAKALLQRAEDDQADLIVLGPHERRSVFDFGSTARAILARTSVPVWVQIEPVTPIQRILVPIDFSDNSRDAMEVAHALASRTKADVTVLSAYAPPAFGYTGVAEVPGPTYVIEEERKAVHDSLDAWMKEFTWGDVSCEPRFVDGDATDKIVEEAGEHDLVVMGTHGRSGLSRFLVGSVAYGVLKHTEKPVLVVPTAHRKDESEGERG